MLKSEQVEWVVNDLGDLGVKIGDQFFWLYKGESLVYTTPDETHPKKWRPVEKREFGEVCRPPGFNAEWEPGARYTEGEGWKDLPLTLGPESEKVSYLAKTVKDGRRWTPNQVISDFLEKIADTSINPNKLLLLHLEESGSQYKVGFSQAGMRMSDCLALLEVVKVLILREMGYGK